MAKPRQSARPPERRQEHTPRTEQLEAKLRDPKFRLTVQIVLTSRRWRSMLDEKLRTIGTSAARMEALSTIDRSPWLSAQVEIANRMGIEKPTLTRMLDMLEAESLVERLPDPWDRRAKLIRLTSEGEKTLGTANEVASGLREIVLDEFDDEELVQFNGLLERLLTRLDRGAPDGKAE